MNLNALPRHKLTADEFHKMAEVGILHEGDRLELIDGEIMEMSPIGNKHASLVKRLSQLFHLVADTGFIVSTQDPVRLSDSVEPEPDIAILKYREDTYYNALPTADDVLLIIEVADSSYDYDRIVKAPLYAAHGVPETWLINVETQTLERYLFPTASGYLEATTHTVAETLNPLFNPALAVDLRLLGPHYL